MTDDKDKPHISIEVFEIGKRVMAEAASELHVQHEMIIMLHRALAIALGVSGREVMVTLGDNSELPEELDYVVDETLEQPRMRFFTKPNPKYNPTGQEPKRPAGLDERITKQQILTTAQIGAYGLQIHRKSGRPIDRMRPYTPEELIAPTSGVLLMAQAHWETLDDSDKSFHIKRAFEYLNDAVKENAWPVRKGRKK